MQYNESKKHYKTHAAKKIVLILHFYTSPQILMEKQQSWAEMG